jgi:hypothetical protein
MYKHHAYTISHYSYCAHTDQLEHPMTGDYRNTHVVTGSQSSIQQLYGKINHNNNITSIMLHKA